MIMSQYLTPMGITRGHMVCRRGKIKAASNPKLEERRMAGVAGFEPTYDGIKNRCLTAWRHPRSGWEDKRFD